jgi:hypothetical protein
MITQADINALIVSATQTGFNLSDLEIQLIQWNAGATSHIPTPLPPNMAAVYIFKWEETYLKVGKVNSNSNARFQSQHYNPASSPSNLAKSILNDGELNHLIGDLGVSQWIKTHTTRFNVLIPSELGKNFVHFAEAFFILKCNPRYENTRA